MGTSKKGEDVFSSLHREIDRVFDEVTHREHWPFPAALTKGGKLSRRINVSEVENEIEITAELPGLEEKDLGEFQMKLSAFAVRADVGEATKERPLLTRSGST